MKSFLTQAERNALKNRPRKKVKCKGRKGYTLNMPETRPAELAKARTCDGFFTKITNQMERYGYTTGDERRLRRLIACMKGIIETYEDSPYAFKAEEKAKKARRKRRAS